MMERLVHRRKFVGIDIGSGTVRFALPNDGKTGAPTIYTVPVQAQDDGTLSWTAEVGSELAAWLQRHGAHGGRAVIGLPTGQTLVRTLRLPKLSNRLLKAAIQAEVGTQLRLPFDNPVYDYSKLPAQADGTDVVVFAADRKRVKATQDLVASAGLRPVAVEPRSIALLRAVTKTQKESSAACLLVVDVQPEWVEMSWFLGCTLISARVVSIRLSDVTDSDATDAQKANFAMFCHDLGTEIGRYMNFVQYGKVIGHHTCDQIVLCFPGERAEVMAASVQANVERPVIGVNLDAVGHQLTGYAESGAYVAASGLALRKEKVRWI